MAKNEATPAVLASSTAGAVVAPRAGADGKAHEFAFRVVEFADTAACRKFFAEKAVDFDRPNQAGWSLLMRICACGRDDLVGYAVDATSIITCATEPNRTNALHLAAMSTNPRVMQELAATPERRARLEAIVDTPNINGDTPLMMACVSKNADAVRVLLTDLDADASFGNANGMTALMCAARLNDTTTQHPAQLMAASEAIVRLLLTRDGIQVNATDIASGNTALHFAVLSHNTLAVDALTGPSASSVDVAVHNKAGMTPLELGVRAGASLEIMERLGARLAAQEAAAAERSRALELELLATSSAPKASPAHMQKSSNKKAAKRVSGAVDRRRNGAVATSTVVAGATQGMEVSTISSTDDKERGEETETADESNGVMPEPDVAPASETSDDVSSADWQAVDSKKSKKSKSKTQRKATPSSEPQAAATGGSATDAAQQHRRRSTNSTVPSKKPSQLTSGASAPKAKTKSTGKSTTAAPTCGAADSGHTLLAAQATGAVETRASAPSVDSTVRDAAHGDEQTAAVAAASTLSYHSLNAIFHRTFPMADELDIPIESFVIASSATDKELQPSVDGLSISQLEVLQEAHLIAYHYLNEKKMELTRVLEAQRLEAQFALQNEILHLQ